MIPILFPVEIGDCRRLGKGKLTAATRCVIHEELNGDFYLEIDYPVTGEHYQDMIAGGVIGANCPAPMRGQTSVGYVLDMFDIMRDVGTEIGGITGSSETCRKENTEIKALTHLWACLQVHFLENL